MTCDPILAQDRNLEQLFWVDWVIAPGRCYCLYVTHWSVFTKQWTASNAFGRSRIVERCFMVLIENKRIINGKSENLFSKIFITRRHTHPHTQRETFYCCKQKPKNSENLSVSLSQNIYKATTNKLSAACVALKFSWLFSHWKQWVLLSLCT